jgi:hypothetical protein
MLTDYAERREALRYRYSKQYYHFDSISDIPKVRKVRMLAQRQYERDVAILKREYNVED